MIILLLLSVLISLTLSDDVPKPTGIFQYSQKVDHYSYSPEASQTFSQRLFEYNKHWDCGPNGTVGPLFVYTGNEGPLESFYYNTGFMFEIAPAFGALILFVEHRYYGESLPFGSESFSNDGLRYLSSTQATADFAEVINHYKKSKNITQVVSFGGSYGGMLTAWMRLRYPQLVDVALAASAPLPMMARTAKPKQAFFEIVTEDFKAADERCPDIVRKGFSQLYNIVKTPGYQASVTDTFKLCKTFDVSQFNHLVGWARNAMLMMAMVDYPYPASFMGELPAWPVKHSCKMMLEEMETSGNEMRALAVGAGLLYNGTDGTKSCFNIYEDFIECADITGCGTGPEAKAWDFQCCTEFQLATPSTNVTDMFPPLEWNLDIASKYCEANYKVSPDPVDASLNYWSADFSAASNIIFSNGLLDPWHAGGVLEDVNPTVKAIIIAEGAHHLDLRGSNKDDPMSVILARNQEVALIAEWLGQKATDNFTEDDSANLVHF
ncbi:dipeptidyl peptidase 2-like [Bolinopsis microptera]|uniref:dipeptidyl peptidase 2-like n=1 Tax=Bolinopsis microptera TaxID=2820187 RepID=UPI00307910AC